MPEPVLAMCREIQAWAKGGDVKSTKNPWADKDVYPIAYIDGNLYFMNNKEYAQLNAQWGNNTMFLYESRIHLPQQRPSIYHISLQLYFLN